MIIYACNIPYIFCIDANSVVASPLTGKQQVIELVLGKVADVHAQPHTNYRK